MGTKAQVEVPTGVVTALLADVEGSVRRWEADADAMAKQMRALEDLLDELIPAHNGVRPLEQGEGDSFVAAFAVPADAVACAVALQAALRDGDLRVRMAIHTDDAILRGTTNYSGAVVNRAARLRALAHGGQVVVSGATRELVMGKECDAGFVDLGIHRLRDVPAPVHVWQLSHPSIAADFPALRSPDALSTNLPAQLTTFVGRIDELRATRKLLFENRLLSLTGAGGTGKTRLALELAADAFDAYPAGVWFVDFTPVRDPAEVPATIAAALHLGDHPARSAQETIGAHFADDRVLLVLDNCEHIVGAAASFVDGVLRHCPNLDVVVTSREPLNVGGEATYQVPPMELPDTDADAGALADNDAVELFVDRAHRADTTFELDDATARNIAKICRQVDGLPLAIELAAARARTMSLDAIADTLSRRFDLLTGGLRTAPLRQQSVAECVAWSYDLLDEPERALLQRLSVFADSFALDAVESVCAGAPVPRDRVLPTLLALVDKSLVRAAGDRYSLLVTVREFARDRMSAEDTDELRQRHLDFLVDLATRSQDGLAGPEQRTWLIRLRAEDPDVDAALDWAAGHDRQQGLRLATALVRAALHSVSLLRGWWRVSPFLDEIDGADPKVAADACFSAALTVLFCGDMALAVRGPEFIADAERRYEQLGDDAGAARSRALLALMAVQMHCTKETRAQCDVSVAELRAAGDEQWAAMISYCVGGRLVQIGRASTAMPYLAEAHEVATRLGHQWLLTMIDTFRAGALSMTGDYQASMRLAERVLAELSETQDPDHGSFMNFVIGDGLFHLGDLDAAERHARIAADMGERHLIRQHAALGHGLLGRVHLEQRRPDLARHDFEAALRLSDLFPHSLARHSTGLANALLRMGDLPDARAAVERGLGVARAGLPSSDLARLLLVLAEVEAREGNDEVSEDVTHEALAVSVEVGARSLAGGALEHLAAIAARQESDVEAVRLFAAAAMVREGLGRRAGDDSVLEVTRTRIDDAAFSAAWAEGASMTLEEAVAYAARGRGTRKRPSSGWASLTPTETDVVRLVAQGLSNPQIGERLLIARGTVRTHLTHIFTKLGVTSRSQLAAEATRQGLS